LLQSAGVNIGKKLVSANEGNPKGYFENADFVDFHENVLFSLGIDKIGWTTIQNCVPPLHYVTEAKKLIDINKDNDNPWGWKEPRTTLFLDFWLDLLPCAYFIFIYRSPWEVLDSLYRRGDDIFKHNPELALQAWSTYNQKLLRFNKQYTEKCLLINLDKITDNPFCLVEMINEKFNLSLSQVDSSLYDASALKREVKKSQRPHLIKVYFPEIWQQYQELNLVSNFEDSILEEIEHLPNNAWVLQDWLNVKLLENQLKHEVKSSREHLESVYQQLGETRGEKEAIEFKLQDTQSQLQDTQSQLQDTQSQLQDTQSQLQDTQSQLQDTQSQLQDTQSQLQDTQSQLQDTQSQLQDTQSQLQDTQSQLQDTQSQLHNVTLELQQSQVNFKQLHFYFDRSQEELKKTQDKLKEEEESLSQIKIELEKSQEIIKAMESSKFWQLRNKWFRLKGGLKLTDEEI
jgi:predicted  nucleic acid-binding Zn-ribbon protein